MRGRMNEYLGIRHDNDIVNCVGASRRQVEAFEVDGAPPPTMMPMRVDWSSGSTSKWNQALFTDYYRHFKEDMRNAVPPIDVAKSEVEKMFYNLLDRLRQHINASKVRRHECDADVATRVGDRAATNRRLASRRTRRQQVRD